MIWLSEDICYCEGARAILTINSAEKFDEKKLDPKQVGGYRVAPWGKDNTLPQFVMEKIDDAEIVGTNANFNWKVCYGLGPKIVRLVRDKNNNRVVDYFELDDGEEFEWFVRNDISLYMMKSLTDLSYFHNAFPILIPDKSRKKIEGLRSREAMFSRWGLKPDNDIKWHLYCSKWDDNPAKADIEESIVIDEFNAYQEIQEQLKSGRYDRFCFPVYMPSPGRPYYSYPPWYSVLRSGWYDNIVSIPALKKAILKHNLGIKYIIYISPKYFENKARQEGIPADDFKKMDEFREKLVTQLSDKLTGEDNAGKSIMSTKELMPTGSSAIEEKYITVEVIKNDINSGEFLTDYESGANVISYAMEVHPSLIGAVPGKNSNSLSGSNIREIFLMKQALSKPMTDRAMRPFSIIKQINGWDKDIAVIIPEYTFTTLDQAKSGKQESTNNVSE